MKKNIGILLIILCVIILSSQNVLAYIDPGTAGSVVGGVGAGIGLIFAFFGSLAAAIMFKIKKIWKYGVFGKIAIFLAVMVIIAIIYVLVSMFIG